MYHTYVVVVLDVYIVRLITLKYLFNFSFQEVIWKILIDFFATYGSLCIVLTWFIHCSDLNSFK